MRLAPSSREYPSARARPGGMRTFGMRALGCLLFSGCAPASGGSSIELAGHRGFEHGLTEAVPTIPTVVRSVATGPSLADYPPPSTEAEPAAEDEEPATPHGVLPPPDPGPPRLRLLPSSRSSCDYAVEARGFPAIRLDGSQFAFVYAPVSPGADYDDQPLLISTHTLTDEAIAHVEVVDGEEVYTASNGRWGKACRAKREEIAARIATLNASFAEGWRPLVRVPVQWPWHVNAGAALPEVPADGHARPVEVLYHAGHFVARVRGMKVLQSTPMPWRHEEPEWTPDAPDPAILALYHDATTGFAVAELSYESASCISDPTVHTAVIELSPEVVAEARARAEFLIPDPA